MSLPPCVGLPPPREDVPVPSEVLSPEDADALATLLYVADFIAEFKDKMGQPIAPITYPVSMPGDFGFQTLLGVESV